LRETIYYYSFVAACFVELDLVKYFPWWWEDFQHQESASSSVAKRKIQGQWLESSSSNVCQQQQQRPVLSRPPIVQGGEREDPVASRRHYPLGLRNSVSVAEPHAARYRGDNADDNMQETYKVKQVS
jgi:hypothetical protein